MKLVQALIGLTAMNLSLASKSKLEMEASKNLKSPSLRRGRSLQLNNPCPVLMKQTEYGDGTPPKKTFDCELPDGRLAAINNLSESTRSVLTEIIGNGGHPTLKAKGATVTEDGITLPSGVRPEIVRNDNANPKRRLKVGNYSVLAVRVDAPDASTSGTETAIGDSIFGNNVDPFNLVSGYKTCSYDKLIFEKKAGETGVRTVTINQSVSGVSDGIVRDAVVNQLNQDLGASANTVYDYVMLCLPPGTSGGWIAYAYINWYLSVYNDQWCTYPSGQMHELGHNIGLAHAGETATYDDQSGMMGYSYSNDDGPVMCFNAAKNWQLGWYDNMAETVTGFWTGQLLGISDYAPDYNGDNRVIIQVPGETEDYYVSFNRKVGINSGTVEGGNQVLVHKRSKGIGYAESDLLAKLSTGSTYNGAPLSVKVISIDTSANPGYAIVEIGSTPPPTAPPAPTATPTAAPTQEPTTASPTQEPTTAAPTSAPTPAPTERCGDGICERDDAEPYYEDCNTCPQDCIGGTTPGASCSNGICEAGNGESFSNCPEDCNGKTNGNPSRQFQCGGTAGCDNPECNVAPYQCTEVPVASVEYCCGDGDCTGFEDYVTCGIDCPAPAPTPAPEPTTAPPTLAPVQGPTGCTSNLSKFDCPDFGGTYNNKLKTCVCP